MMNCKYICYRLKNESFQKNINQQNITTIIKRLGKC